MRRLLLQFTVFLNLLLILVLMGMQPKKVETSPVTVAAAEPKETPLPPEGPAEVAHEPAELDVTAEFSFYGARNNPGVPSGKFAMKGHFTTASGKLNLEGSQWIQQPPGFDMVPLSGRIDANREVFRGRIRFAGCKEFELKRVRAEATTPIAGVWEGIYTCGQGQTGLTLTIF